jgi:hypothetical protein
MDRIQEPSNSTEILAFSDVDMGEYCLRYNVFRTASSLFRFSASRHVTSDISGPYRGKFICHILYVHISLQEVGSETVKYTWWWRKHLRHYLKMAHLEGWCTHKHIYNNKATNVAFYVQLVNIIPVDNSTGCLIIYYESFRTINFYFVPYSYPDLRVIEWYVEDDV